MMQETHYGLKVTIPVQYDEAIAGVTDALKSQGFGVLTTIDVKQTLKAKLDRDFRKYVILGACNPPLADRALRAELEVGLLLPCNVIVYEVNPSSTVVAAMAPLGIVGENPSLASVAREADERLRKALVARSVPVATSTTAVQSDARRDGSAGIYGKRGIVKSVTHREARKDVASSVRVVFRLRAACSRSPRSARIPTDPATTASALGSDVAGAVFLEAAPFTRG